MTAAKRLPAAGLKWLLFALILALVGWQAWRMGQEIDLSKTQFRPAWLIPAAGCYFAGWWPAVFYWRALLARQGRRVGWYPLARAYFCGHLGKYVPGKAAVVVIRGVMLRAEGVPFAVAGLTAAQESLTTMAAGGAMGAALAPWIVPASWWQRLGEDAHLWAGPISLACFAACLAALPIVDRLIALLVRRTRHGDAAADALPPAAHAPPGSALRPDWLSFLGLMGGWWLHGLSLGCTIQAIAPESVSPISLAAAAAGWAGWTAGACFATVLGFVVLFAPGGTGVREWVLMTLYEPTLGPAALLLAGLLRLVWLGTELGAAGLFWAVPPSRAN